MVHLGGVEGDVSSPLSARLSVHPIGGGGGAGGGPSFSPHAGTAGSIVSNTSPVPDRNPIGIQTGRLDLRPPLTSDSNNGNMTLPNAGGFRGNKKRGGSRLLIWVSLLVFVVIVIILVEDEMELRTASDLAPDVSFKNDGLGGDNKMNSKLPVPGSDSTTNSMDDDLFTYSWSNLMNVKKPNLVSTAKHSARNPPPAEYVKKKKTAKNAKKQKKKLRPFPVIQYDDDKIPTGVAGSITHAADSLLCRDSVIDYVINATDLKDECDGLKKAFTKNCADDTEQTAVQRRRLLLLEQQHNRGGNPVAYLQHRIHRLTRSIQRWMEPKAPVFMAEDEILNVWESSSIEVEQGWDLLYRAEDIEAILRPWSVEVSWDAPVSFEEFIDEIDGPFQMENATMTRRLERRISERREKQKSDEGQTDGSEEVPETDESPPISTDPPAKVKNRTIVARDPSKPLMNLALPTTVKHVSEKMLSETLMLQQDNKIMKAVQNQTNITINEAQADAAASSKAVADAADLVSNVLNDPTSVEARTCCTSILNVFHENCSVNDEEELSDSRLFVAVAVIAVCGLIKSLIRHFTVRWLPEAAGCILVGGTLCTMRVLSPSRLSSSFIFLTLPPLVFSNRGVFIDIVSPSRH